MAGYTFQAYIEMYNADQCHHCGVKWRPGRSLHIPSPDVQLIGEFGHWSNGATQFDVSRCLHCNGIHITVYRPFMVEQYYDSLPLLLDWKYKEPEL